MRRGAFVLCLPAIALGATAVARGEVSSEARAPVRPAASVYVSTAGNDATCRRTMPLRPCATFDRAFQIARGGDYVDVAAGTYRAAGEITINRHATPLSSAVTFRPARGARVLLGSDIDIRASHFHMTGIVSAGSGETRSSLDVCDASSDCPAALSDVVVTGFRGKSAFIRSSGVTVRGGEFGGYDPCLPGNPEDIFRIWGGGAAPQPSHVVVDGVVVHDNDDHHTSTACPGTPNEGIHVDCLQAVGGTDITIENTVMYNCATSNIQAQPFNGATMSNWVVQNNFFGKVLHPGNSVVLGMGDCSSLVLRYNTIDGPQPNASGCTSGDLVGYGNVYLQDTRSLPANFVQSYSVFAPRTTAAINSTGNHENRRCAPALVAPAASPPNFRLRAGDRCASAAGDPRAFPRRDIDGRRRPLGARSPDAGADEIR